MNQEMTITNAVYMFSQLDQTNIAVKGQFDGVEMIVPLCEGNRHYDEIMRQVDAGTLTIEDAE